MLRTRKDEIIARVLTLASIMQAEPGGRQASEWNALLAQRWCSVCEMTTRRDLESLVACSVAEVIETNGVRLYKWHQWPMPLN